MDIPRESRKTQFYGQWWKVAGDGTSQATSVVTFVTFARRYLVFMAVWNKNYVQYFY